MIVKNEAAIIGRLLKSCLPVIDCVCVLDTGSTDNTIGEIKQFCDENGLPWVIESEPFVNFGVSRSRALKLAKGLADYILFMDADMILMPSNPPQKEFTAPGYLVEEGNESFQYSNARLVRDDVAEAYSGVTHEHLVTKVPITDKLDWKINHVGDGGSKSDKFARDELLLRHGLIDEPNNSRYLFYLANTLYDTGRVAEAKEFYEKRVSAGGWSEEVYYSMYRTSLCCKRLGKVDEFITSAYKAWAYRPSRLESICELMNYHADLGERHTAKKLYEVIRSTPPSDDILFVHRACRVDADYKYTLIAYYLKETEGVFPLYGNIFNATHLDLYSQFNNYKFYCPIPIPSRVVDLAPMCEAGDLHPSTPCILKTPDHYLVNVRVVNYVLEGTRYIYDGCVHSENQMLELNYDFTLRGSKRLPQPTQICDKYNGYEDVRVTKEGKFSCTWARSDEDLGVSIGDYPAMLNVQHLKTFTSCEKNWVFLPGSTRMVYKWKPFTVFDVEGGTLKEHNSKMPRLFELARGSSNGVVFGGETWFVVHYVHQYEAEPRFYYHSLVVLDDDLRCKRYTLPFKFSDSPVEICLGLVVEEDRILLSHSGNDGSSLVSVYSHDAFQTLWIF